MRRSALVFLPILLFAFSPARARAGQRKNARENSIAIQMALAEGDSLAAARKFGPALGAYRKADKLARHRRAGEAGIEAAILTPTNGVNFSRYLTDLISAVKKNWFAVMPISARLGHKGEVAIEFAINRDGKVAAGPTLVQSSHNEPFDRAALSAISLSAPFRPLPIRFPGPRLKLHLIFLYNLPLDSVPALGAYRKADKLAPPPAAKPAAPKP